MARVGRCISLSVEAETFIQAMHKRFGDLNLSRTYPDKYDHPYVFTRRVNEYVAMESEIFGEFDEIPDIGVMSECYKEHLRALRKRKSKSSE